MAASAAEGDGRGSAASAGELVHGVDDDSGTGCSDRVAEGDRAAVRVHDFVGDAELGPRLHDDGGEGLVDLDVIERRSRDALLLADPRDRS